MSPKPKRVWLREVETDDDLHDVIRGLLAELDSDRCEQYSDWISVGKSIYSATDGAGFEVWDKWSQVADSYSSYCMEQKWRSFSNTLATIGTLRWMARQDSGGSVRACASPPREHVRLLLRSAAV